MSNSNYPDGDDDGPPPADDRTPMRRSRSRSPPPRRSRRRSHSRSRSWSRDRSRSPPVRGGGRSRDRSPPPRGGSRGSRGRRSPSRSGSRSRSPARGGRGGRDRFRGRGPPPGYGPPDDFYGGRGGYDRGGPPGGDFGPRGRPPPYEGYYDQYSPVGGPRGDPYGHRGPPPRGGGGPRGDWGERRRGEGPPGVSLLVRNVGPQVNTLDLQMAFGRIGHVRDVYIPRDYHSQQAKGFAFIEYANIDMAREARDEMDHFRIKGCELEVVFAQEHRKTPNEMRGRVVNHQNRGREGGRDGRREGSRDGGRLGGRDGGRGFERSSSFERHKRNRVEEKREGGRHQEKDGPTDDRARNEPGGGDNEAGENGHGGDVGKRRDDSDGEN